MILVLIFETVFVFYFMNPKITVLDKGVYPVYKY